MFEHLAAIAAGYVFSILVGHWATSTLMRTAWLGVTAPLGSTATGGPSPHPQHPAAVGLLERALYTAAWQLGAREFIGLWLVLKALGNWKGWVGDTPHGTGTISGRTTFSLFLLGAGTSLAFGVTGALITEMLDHNDWALALALGGAAVAGSFALGWFLRRRPA
jgi:hypothetical protein